MSIEVSGGIFGYDLNQVLGLLPTGPLFRDGIPVLGRPPTDEQKQRRDRRQQAALRLARIVLSEHGHVVAGAPEAVRPFLELHGPVYTKGYERWGAHCDGCDVGGQEGEQPEFPCSTYRLALRAMR